MYFSLDISLEATVLLSCAATAILTIFFIYLWRLRRIAVRRKACSAATGSPGTSTGVSVVIYSRDEVEALERTLPAILEQEYGGPFEVIVVNEGESLDIRDLISRLQLTYKNIYLTHTPDGAHNLSRKKLAVMLGVKAARNPVALMVTASTVIRSKHWLAAMMSGFDKPGTEVVLGAAVVEGTSRTVAFDDAADSADWISAALAGHPFRGTEHNLAYRRDTFFRNKGFSRSLNLRHGDDDIFISEIATASNTVTELAPDAVVGVAGAGSYTDRSIRRNFTLSHIKRPHTLMHLMWWFHPVAVACACVAVAFQWGNMAVWGAALLALVFLAVLDICFWRPVLGILCSRRLLLSIPTLCLFRPFRRLALRIATPIHRQKRYTWD